MHELQTWLVVALAVWNFLLTVAIWLRKPGEDASEAVASLEKKHAEALAAVNTELATFRERMQHMPTDDELSELRGDLQAIAAQLGVLPNMQRDINRITDFLMNNK